MSKSVLEFKKMSVKPKILVMIANLGTPDEPTTSGVRRFLEEFLSDGRVIEIPKFLWKIILYSFVLPFRPKKVAQAYAQIWTEDSPMRLILNQQVQALHQRPPRCHLKKMSARTSRKTGSPPAPSACPAMRPCSAMPTPSSRCSTSRRRTPCCCCTRPRPWCPRSTSPKPSRR